MGRLPIAGGRSGPKGKGQALSAGAQSGRLPVLALAVPAAVALFYALGHLTWYLGTPLGRVPVLDERENIDLALAISGGTLEHAPFYRAPGYALLLALVRLCGIPASGLFPAALALGCLLHAANAALVSALSGRWFGPRAALLGGLLLGLDPVLVHYATQALDATFSLTLFLVGINFLTRGSCQGGKDSDWAGASLSWAGAGLVRPNFLLAWAALLPAAAVIPGPRLRRLTAALAGVVLLGAMALWQGKVGGVASFMPWQGAYNLWAANRPGANGRFYTQHVSLSPEAARGNPARAESILLYQAENKGQPADIPRMNAYWRGRFMAEVTGHPARWALFMARKAYALLNTWEQYNNKTFAFHKALSPWLSWNPICWGILLVLGVAGAARLRSESPFQAVLLSWVTLALAASIILFFVSARFRLPLVAILAALSGGCLASPGFWSAWTPGRRVGLLAAVVATGLVTFSRLGGVDDTSTFVQDHALLARAAYTVGDDALALGEANEALKLQPWHPDALAVAAAARKELSEKAPAVHDAH